MARWVKFLGLAALAAFALFMISGCTGKDQPWGDVDKKAEERRKDFCDNNGPFYYRTDPKILHPLDHAWIAKYNETGAAHCGWKPQPAGAQNEP